MPTRREFLKMSVCSSALLLTGVSVMAQGKPLQAGHATAITQVFGDGVRLVAVAIALNEVLAQSAIALDDFQVTGRTVIDVFTSTSTSPHDKAPAGRYLVIMLSPNDAGAALAQKLSSPGGMGGGPNGKPGGVGKAGDIPVYDTAYKTAQAVVTQRQPLRVKQGGTIIAPGHALATSAVHNLVVDDFQQLEFHDPQTGKLLRYNLYVPRHYQPGQSYPLVLFMHDAGATSDMPRATLFQGLGAITWASPEDQAKRPCFVLAPQFAEIIADDDSHTSAMLDTTINLIEHLTSQYSIDHNRLYTTGQSGGCMMSIAMDIKYPDFFAASFLVAGQWSPDLVKPLARQKLFILVSQDDDKAFPGQNAITAVLKREGASIGQAVWDGTWSADQYRQAFNSLTHTPHAIYYVSFSKGTVIPPGQSAQGAGGHRNTWRIAYTIEPIREWLFSQHR